MAGRAGRPLSRSPAFWDASALVPLCIPQALTARCSNLYDASDVYVWWATPVEIASALARLLRMRQIGPSEYAKAQKLADALSLSWSVIKPSEALRRTAMGLVDRHDLRAGDALQLAAALEWCTDSPRGEWFLTADRRLREAALLAGFDAKTI